jgi:ABC-2 type transport system ATP-binding protein
MSAIMDRSAGSAGRTPNWESPSAVVRVRGLRKSYDGVEVIRGIDLDVHAGEIFAFLGPNGAGKTTTVEILEGYRSRDAGEIEVLGRDPREANREWRALIGVVLQTCSVQPELTVSELLRLYGCYYPAPLSVDETLELVGLELDRDKRAGALSGGQQRRLDVGLALVGNPRLLFLDEPTTGFDPSARHHAWDVIAGLRGLGKTVFLTTHYMDEAEALADRVAIIAGGQIVAEGTTADLGGRAQVGAVVSFRLPDGVTADELPPLLEAEVSVRGPRVELHTAWPTRVLATLAGWGVERGCELSELEAHRPSLEEIYLQLTGGA